MGGVPESGGRKMGTTVLEPQQKIRKKEKIILALILSIYLSSLIYLVFHGFELLFNVLIFCHSDFTLAFLTGKF